uniref:Uncharacterized protein n=1 Tax=Steinernema glaseri TaxID=37863 RepID=A0A1I7Z1W4_9BILA
MMPPPDPVAAAEPFKPQFRTIFDNTHRTETKLGKLRSVEEDKRREVNEDKRISYAAVCVCNINCLIGYNAICV